VSQNGGNVVFSKNLKEKSGDDTVEFFTRELQIVSDILIEFAHLSMEQKMFSLAFNMGFSRPDSRGRLVFTKNELHGADTDINCEHFKKDFCIEIFVLNSVTIKLMKDGTLSDLGHGAGEHQTPQQQIKHSNPRSRDTTPGRQRTGHYSTEVTTSTTRDRDSVLGKGFSASAPILPSERSAVPRMDVSTTVNDRAGRVAWTHKREQLAPRTLPSARSGDRKSFFLYRRTATENALGTPVQLCHVCGQSTETGGCTIEILLNTTVHVECLRCGTCGKALQGQAAESVIEDGVITCSACAKHIFPTCKICGIQIRADAIRSPSSSESFHNKCLKCADCDRNLADGHPYCVSNKRAFCHNCSVTRGLRVTARKARPTIATPEEVELIQIMQNKLSQKHFRKFLETRNAINLLSFYDYTGTRRGLQEKERESATAYAEHYYLSNNGPERLPEDLRAAIRNMLQQELQNSPRSGKEIFKMARQAAFQYIARNHVRDFAGSSHFNTYVQDLCSRPDFEEEEEALRRSRVAKFIPVIPSDLPTVRIKTVPELDQDEVRAVAEHEKSLRESLMEEDELLAEQKEVEQQAANARAAEELRRKQEADAQEEAERVGREEALEKVRQAQQKAKEASARARQLALSNIDLWASVS